MNDFSKNNKDNRQDETQRNLFDRKERPKELNVIKQATAILKRNATIEDMLQAICFILPDAWQYADFTAVRIKFGTDEFVTSNFKETKWFLRRVFETIDDKEGSIEIYYLKEFPLADEGLFLKEERYLINNLATLISGYLNTMIGKKMLKTSQENDENNKPARDSHDPQGMSMQLLQRFLIKHNSDRDIYHDLMPYKVGEILLVANLYDAYIIEKEGRFFEQLTGEYYQLNLSSVPRITSVSSSEEALEKLQLHHYDLVILMMGIDKQTPVQLSQIIKRIYPNVPILCLLNNNSDAGSFENIKIPSIDKIFVWNGDSKVFLAMVKYIEDLMNIDNDTKIGLVRVILLVEDSAKYYSRFLPILYSLVIEQTQHLIEEVNTDSLYKILRMRARPKIVLVSNYEEALEYFNKYKEFLLCLITDIKYEKHGAIDKEAGLKLAEYVKKEIPDLPVLLQSSDAGNAPKASILKATFVDKNSENLLMELRNFINYYLGFGNFIFRNGEEQDIIAEAHSLKEFETQLKTIPEETLLFHGMRNHFSNWFMARGEIQLAKKLKPVKVSDFNNPKELRLYMLEALHECLFEKNKGKVVNFDESAILDETAIVSLATGSLGGKGRGLAFINTLIYNFDFPQLVPEINVRTPVTSIIGTDEFEYFMESNGLHDKINNENNFEKIKSLFAEAKLSEPLVKKLRKYLKIITKPIAIRSSSLFEDSLTQPFAGIFDTFLLPNNNPDIDVRLEQMMTAVKMVYASIFSPTSKAYFTAINYKIEEEKMAVIVQEVVGALYDETFYPHISGVAQSYNYYPVSHMKPEDGFAVLAVGLGKYVVDGEKTYRYCPEYPSLEIYSTEDMYKNSQLHFYAVDMRHKEFDLTEGEDASLVKLDIDVSEKHGTLKHCGSVYDLTNDRIIPGLTDQGPRIVNFADIIKHKYIPLSETIQVILNVVEEAMGSPVEIEFAVNLNKTNSINSDFYLLQIKPLIKNVFETNINIGEIDYGKLLLYSEMGMGNGIIDDLTDVIFVDINKFDKIKTEKMRDEIDHLNSELIKENRKYILIGPGRWGTRDRFIGIPVAWSQISNAKIIVEVSLEDFPLDASLGSHFFHNVISMDVGYFSIKHNSLIDSINWDVLNKQKIINETKFFRHVRFKHPLKIIMDGRKRTSLIYFNK